MILKPNNFNGMDMFKEWKRGDCQKKVMKWSPPGRRKRGRPKLTWAEEIRGLMGGKGINGRRLEWQRQMEEEDNIIVKWAQAEAALGVRGA